MEILRPHIFALFPKKKLGPQGYSLLEITERYINIIEPHCIIKYRDIIIFRNTIWDPMHINTIIGAMEMTRFDLHAFHSLTQVDHPPYELIKCFPEIIHPAIGVARIPDFKDDTAAIAAAIKRVLQKQDVDYRVLEEFRTFVRQWLQRNLEPIPEIELTEANLDKYWLDNSKYNQAKKSMFHQRLREFLAGDSKGLYDCKSFVKKECYDDFKYPRLISSRSDKWKAVCAIYVKEIEHRVIYNEHFIKGKNKHEFVHRLTHIQDNFLHLYETDYSSFEGSFSRELMCACELQLFTYMLKYNRRILSLIRTLYHGGNRMFFRGSGQITCRGSRMSGDMWTSLCNGFTNMMLFLFAVSKSSASGKDFDYVVEGDDGLLATNFRLETQPIAALGFKLKIHEAENLNHLSFCGICVHNDLFVPDITRTLRALPYTFDEGCRRSSRRRREMARAKAFSLLHESSGIPILQPLAKRMIYLTQGSAVRERDFDWWEREWLLPDDFMDEHKYTRPITSDMRLFVERRFDITVQEQLVLEEEISRCSLDERICPWARVGAL